MSGQPARPARVDPITFELASAALLSAAVEMGGVLKHSSYSPIIREMDDFSCAVFRADGDLVAQADFIPAQLGAMSLVVKSIIDRWGDAVAPGDAYLANHPYLGAMHTPDLNVIMPIFIGGDLAGWAGTAAHHIDVGGVRPGTEGPDLSEVYAEGLLLPPVRLYLAGKENPDVFAFVAAAVRDPVSTLSDLRAQRAACLVGERRVAEIAGRYSPGVLARVFDMMLESVERAVRLDLAELPDGDAEAEGFLDDDGVGGPPTRIHVRLAKHGDALVADLSGSAPQVRGAMNVPWASTRASVVYAIRAMTDPSRATNDGVLRAVEIICPRGTVLNPEPPGAVSVRHNTCQRLADTLIRAASQMWPDRAVASSTVAFFGMNLESVSPRTGVPSVMAEVAGGGTGAHRGGDGLDGVDTYMANVGLMPVEVAESSYSVRILRTELIAGSQGDGEYRGGLGLRRDYQVLGRESTVTLYSEQTDPRFAPRGVLGGTDGQPSLITVFDPAGRPMPIGSKASLVVQPGSIIRIETSGGGGYGDPARRDPALRLADERDGRV
ncbi:MAG TPA: hydantoinase B/oxoprolinase family protein [Streptosporangiaceae bacterium]|nr:hydantoinase B/oxoprolinase family protein [Streptosporangiaceae bacterium]